MLCFKDVSLFLQLHPVNNCFYDGRPSLFSFMQIVVLKQTTFYSSKVALTGMIWVVLKHMHDFNEDLELRNCGQSQQRSVRGNSLASLTWLICHHSAASIYVWLSLVHRIGKPPNSASDTESVCKQRHMLTAHQYQSHWSYSSVKSSVYRIIVIRLCHLEKSSWAHGETGSCIVLSFTIKIDIYMHQKTKPNQKHSWETMSCTMHTDRAVLVEVLFIETVLKQCIYNNY
jgi:hypothetical protein